MDKARPGGRIVPIRIPFSEGNEFLSAAQMFSKHAALLGLSAVDKLSSLRFIKSYVAAPNLFRKLYGRFKCFKVTSVFCQGLGWCCCIVQ